VLVDATPSLYNLGKTACRSVTLRFPNRPCVLALPQRSATVGSREPLLFRAAVGDGRIPDRLFRSGSLAHLGREGRLNHPPNPAPVFWFEAGRSIGTFQHLESRMATKPRSERWTKRLLCDFDIHRRYRRRNPCSRYRFQLASSMDVRCRRSYFDWPRERLWRLLTIIRRPPLEQSSAGSIAIP
jgi:hypothetical protein